jgi:hypothetical protein
MLDYSPNSDKIIYNCSHNPKSHKNRIKLTMVPLDYSVHLEESTYNSWDNRKKTTEMNDSEHVSVRLICSLRGEAL